MENDSKRPSPVGTSQIRPRLSQTRGVRGEQTRWRARSPVTSPGPPARRLGALHCLPQETPLPPHQLFTPGPSVLLTPAAPCTCLSPAEQSSAPASRSGLGIRRGRIAPGPHCCQPLPHRHRPGPVRSLPFPAPRFRSRHALRSEAPRTARRSPQRFPCARGLLRLLPEEQAPPRACPPPTQPRWSQSAGNPRPVGRRVREQ